MSVTCCGWVRGVGIDRRIRDTSARERCRRMGRGDQRGKGDEVQPYREKRRTRLFAKKIRYEVRKLNAEQRPRIKGRFVKRTPLLT